MAEPKRKVAKKKKEPAPEAPGPEPILQAEEPAAKPKAPRKPRAKKEKPKVQVADPSNATLKDVVALHSRETPDDGRVKTDEFGVFKGKHFDPDDPLHQYVLGSRPEAERKIISKVQQAIANIEPVYFSYHHKPTKGAKSRASREAEYKTGERVAEAKGYSVLPVHVGAHLNKVTNEPEHLNFHGLSASEAARNGHLMNSILGEHSPYPVLEGEGEKPEKFKKDWAGFLRNLNNGYTGDGKAEIKGTENYPVTPTPGYKPHPLEAMEADFLNAMLHNDTAKYNSSNSRIAKEINQAQDGSFLHNGEVNYLRHELDRVAVERGLIEPGKSWTDKHLTPAIHTFNANQVGEMHWNPQDLPEALRPSAGTEAIHKGLLKEGEPPGALTGANPRSPQPKEQPQEQPKAQEQPEAKPEAPGPPGPGEALPQAAGETPAKPRTRKRATPWIQMRSPMFREPSESGEGELAAPGPGEELPPAKKKRTRRKAWEETPGPHEVGKGKVGSAAAEVVAKTRAQGEIPPREEPPRPLFPPRESPLPPVTYEGPQINYAYYAHPMYKAPTAPNPAQHVHLQYDPTNVAPRKPDFPPPEEQFPPDIIRDMVAKTRAMPLPRESYPHNIPGRTQNLRDITGQTGPDYRGAQQVAKEAAQRAEQQRRQRLQPPGPGDVRPFVLRSPV